jgi:hypothetical protein
MMTMKVKTSIFLRKLEKKQLNKLRREGVSQVEKKNYIKNVEEKKLILKKRSNRLDCRRHNRRHNRRHIRRQNLTRRRQFDRFRHSHIRCLR